ncbi:MAG: 3-deoxy-D-manno-octulosonic acid transferase [Pseudomonadota bacterium]|jgi:3-deoxy-D-manno-octulosonic-acid transferase|nr:3-deoxy-D-manno-octulosonic acid transferase [Rubrivivax sp.]MCA3256878.1 3-deoxy-D-manno-octulosonic acid transferase [Rubrivivax sp.]MCZ8029692.1 3-deoxy-D-manno-octulosonic acid transferase [Rubrivivax sp.]
MTPGAAAARAAYSTLLRLATPLYLARLWWRGAREPLYRAALAERLGFVAPQPPGRLWIHAVSLGETRAAAALIEALRLARPELKLLLTHGTATGRAAGAALLREGDAQCWLPYDTPGAVRRFLDRHRPAAGVLMETEVWPNLARAAAVHGLPLVLANARLSERSLRKGLRLAALMRPAAAAITRALAQTEDDAVRLRAIGVRDVVVTGNLKYDMTPAPALLERGRAWRRALGRPVVLAASTREGEETPLLAAWGALPAPRPLLLLVPRHPQRFDAVAALAAQAGFTTARRSAFGDMPPVDAAALDVWLGDSMGEMPLYFALADVALLGGSFAPLGGQNLIEAAACGCPVVMGPHTFNFAQASELALAAGAAERVVGVEAGVRRAAALAWPEPAGSARAVMARHALDFAAAHRGAALRVARGVLAAVAD